MASWTMSPGFIVSFRLLEMLFMGAQRPAGKAEKCRVKRLKAEVKNSECRWEKTKKGGGALKGWIYGLSTEREGGGRRLKKECTKPEDGGVI